MEGVNVGKKKTSVIHLIIKTIIFIINNYKLLINSKYIYIFIELIKLWRFL